MSASQPESHTLQSLAKLPVSAVRGIAAKRAEALDALSVQSVCDLLLHLPRAYQDRTKIQNIGDIKKGDIVTIEAIVVSARLIRLRGRQSMTRVELRDATGTIGATFFGRGFLAKTFSPGTRGIFTGFVAQYQGLSLKSPDYEILSGDEEDRLHTGRIVPMYRLTEGVTQRMMRRWMINAIDQFAPALVDIAPPELLKRKNFGPLGEALRAVHFPETYAAAMKARNRFVYEELLAMQLTIMRDRAQREQDESGIRHRVDGAHLGTLATRLPFALTASQQRVVDDILADMASARPMFRLLQGDVGCGKTVVAMHAIAAAVDGGYQAAIMAPTEVLAEQHARSFRDRIETLGLRCELLTRSTLRAKKLRTEIAAGEVQVVIGTHTLIQESVTFDRLGLIVVDEQHRFGVLQRSTLAQKGLNPDILHMSATPIPRTLTLTLYGAMDLSVIDELPPGRLPIKTRRIMPAKVDDLYGYIARQAKDGFQTYIVCPLVEESDKSALKDVTSHYEELTHGHLHGLRTALLHGRMPGPEKEAILHAFKRREYDVLFSTSVIEVGIDVPSATTMVIEDAPIFGLTQLHQLRGRVGRGADQAYCFLLGTPKTEDGEKRIDALCKYPSGFDIAEIDLEIRGPGELFGVRQAGMTDLRVADLIRDVRLLDDARRDAQRLYDTGQLDATLRALTTATSSQHMAPRTA